MKKCRHLIVAVLITVFAGVIGLILGPNLGEQASGGVLITLSMPQSFNADELAQELSALDLSFEIDVRQLTVDGSPVAEITVIDGGKLEPATLGETVASAARLRWSDASLRTSERIGASLRWDSALNLLWIGALALLIWFLYLWVRAKLVLAETAVIATLLALLMTAALSIALRIKVEEAFFAGLLAALIMGATFAAFFTFLKNIYSFTSCVPFVF